MNDQRNINLIQITLYNLLTKTLFLFFVLLTGMYAARVLVPTDFGKAQYITWLVNMAWLLCNLGVASTMQRHLSRLYTGADSYALTPLFRFAFLGLGLSILVALIAVYSYLIFDAQDIYFGWILLLLVLQFTNSYTQFLLQGIFAYKQMFYVQSTAIVLAAILCYIALPVYGYPAFIAMYLVYYALQIPVWFAVLYKWGKAIPQATNQAPQVAKQHKEWIRTSAYFAVSVILSSALWQRPETYWIKQLFGYDTVSVYLLSLNVVLLMTEPIRMLSGILMSYFSGMITQKDKVELVYETYVRYLAWLAIFLGMFVFVYADEIIRLLYTDKYAGGAVLVKYLIPGFTFAAANFVSMNLLIGLKKIRFLLTQDIVLALLFVGLMVAVVHNQSITLLVVGKSALLILSVVFTLVFMHRLRYKIMLGTYALSLIISGFILSAGKVWLSSMGWAHIMIVPVGILGFVLYVVFSLQIGIIHKNVWQGIKQNLLQMAGIGKK
jgi:O-antigen/teichoic acid export membrane protein